MIHNLGNRVVNTYLVGIQGGYILIDTGYENSFGAFIKRLAKCGIKPKEIKYIFLTHAHDDHAGFLNDVLRITDAPVILHPKSTEGLKRGQNSFEGGCSSKIAYLFCRILALFGHGEHRYPPIKEEYMDRLITIDSAEFEHSEFPCRVIETPGHTADHISLLVGNTLFCGDAAMNNFPSLKRTIIWIEDPKSYKQSWERIIELNPDRVYPAHGKPFPTEDLKRYLPFLDRVKLYPLRPKKK